MCVWSSNQELESHCEISTCSILPRNEWNFSIGHVLFRKPQISGLTTDKIPRIASELNFDRIEFLIQASKIREFILKENLHRFTSSIGRIKRSFVPQYRNEINEICICWIVEELIAARHTKLSLDHSLYFECFYIGLVDNSLFLSWPPTRQPFFFFLSIYCLRLSWPLFARGTFEDTCLF